MFKCGNMKTFSVWWFSWYAAGRAENVTINHRREWQRWWMAWTRAIEQRLAKVGDRERRPAAKVLMIAGWQKRRMTDRAADNGAGNTTTNHWWRAAAAALAAATTAAVMTEAEAMAVAKAVKTSDNCHWQHGQPRSIIPINIQYTI